VQPSSAPGRLVLLGGPAGAGKSTLAAAWCGTRERAVLIELDEIRDLIVAGRADPQVQNATQAEQYEHSVLACVALARVFVATGYDTVITDPFDPPAYARYWCTALEGVHHDIVIVLPSLEETLARSRGRAKRVLEVHTRNQHAAAQGWPEEQRIDTTGLSIADSLAALVAKLQRVHER
jgi:predicted kinase